MWIKDDILCSLCGTNCVIAASLCHDIKIRQPGNRMLAVGLLQADLSQTPSLMNIFLGIIMTAIEIKNHVLVKYAKEFNDLTQHVIKNTPINFVAITRIYDNNMRSYMMSDPVMGEILLTNKYHFVKNTDELAQLCKQPQHLWRVSNIVTFDDRVKKLYEDFVAHNYGNGITLVERGADFVELLHFCADSGYESVNPYLENNIDKLWNHVVHIRQLLHNNNDLKSAFNIRYRFEMDNHPLENIDNSNNIVRLDQYDLGGYFDGIKFTYREIQCLCLMQKEISSKKVARLLGISYRSVEAMLYRVMNKTNIKNKSELLLKLSSNNAFMALQSIL